MLLKDFGAYGQPINYPIVPKGTERLRFTPTPFHDDRMFDHLVRAMDGLRPIAMSSACAAWRRKAA
jgi:5-aminolevulinate synthase